MPQQSVRDFDPELVDAVIDPDLRYCSKQLGKAKPKEIQSWIRILRQANTIVLLMNKFLELNKADLGTTTGMLAETAHALLDIGTAPGRSVESGLGHYAHRLSNVFKLYYGRYKPEWVGNALAKTKIPGAPNENRKNMVDWVKNLPKRHRQFLNDPHRREVAEFRNARRRLREKLNDPHPKTLATFFPSMLKAEGASFWPDELSSHDPEKCSMCINRRKRARIRCQGEAVPKLKGSGPLDEYSRGEMRVILTHKLMNMLESKQQKGAITKEIFEQFATCPYQSDLHRRLEKAATVGDARKIVDSVNDCVDEICSQRNTHKTHRPASRTRATVRKKH